MSRKYFRTTMVLALLVAGCAAPGTTPTATQPGLDPALLTDKTSARYTLMVAHEGSPALTVTNVEASSTRNSYFPIAYATDDRMTSAWGAAATDTAPTLTFDLSACAKVDAMSIKMSPEGVTVDVAVATGDGEWTTIATGLEPQYATLDWLDLPATDAERIRLTFNGDNASDVLVCDVDFYGERCEAPSPSPSPSATPTPVPSETPSASPTPTPSESPSPSPSPSPTPSESPSPTPTPTPTATPTAPPEEEDCGCKVTGGGWVLSPLADGRGNDKITFGFVAMTKGDGAHGNIQINDHQTKAKFHGEVTAIDCGETSVTFSGTLRDGVSFSCTVVDNGEPGRYDTFEFTTGAGVTISGELGAEFNGGGNIQFHKVKCDE